MVSLPLEIQLGDAERYQDFAVLAFACSFFRFKYLERRWRFRTFLSCCPIIKFVSVSVYEPDYLL